MLEAVENGSKQHLTGPDTEIGKLSVEICDRIERLAPRVAKQKSLMDEEQERELEPEREEEKEVERPNEARPLKPRFSPELKELISFGASKCDLLLKRKFKSLIPHLFHKTTYLRLVNRLIDCTSLEFRNQKIFLSTDFQRTVSGESTDQFLKSFRWVIVTPGQSFVLVSNFEAEVLGTSWLHKKDGLRLRALAPLARPQQPMLFSVNFTIAPPAAVHIFGGSLHPDARSLLQIERWLGLCRSRGESVKDLFQDGHVGRDGFVPVASRKAVAHIQKLEGCMFKNSPVAMIVKFLSNSRHSSAELQGSPIGKLLGVTFMDGCGMLE